MDNEVAGLVTEALANVNGLIALLAVGEAAIQIDPFQLQMLLEPIRVRLAQADASLNSKAMLIVAAKP